MTTLYANFLAGTTTDSPLTSGATTINSSAFSDLPVVASPDIMYLVLDPDASAGDPEVVTVTAHTSAATSVTVTRASQSTTAREHASGTAWRAAVTKADVDAWAAILEDGAIDTDNLAADAVTTAKIAAGAVDTTELAADAVDGTKIADDSIDSEHYVDGSIDTAHLADDAVTPAKLSDTVNAYCTLDGNTQSITGTVDLPFTSGTDPNDWHDPVTNNERVTPDIAGVYLILARVRWDGASGSVDCNVEINITKNGTGVSQSSYNQFVQEDVTQSCSLITTANGTTDYFGIHALQDSGSSLDVQDSDIHVILLQAT